MELEASTIQSPGALAAPRIAIGPRLLRLRSDEQLVALFRSGHDEAFQVIYDRYHKRLAGYARQMLPRGHDPDDVLQDVFVRAYRALRHDDRELAVRPWLFRVAHNCCIDELRRNVPAPTDELYALPSPSDDPAVRLDARETLRRLIEDIERLPEQQRSALLLRELSGISYAELAVVLGTTVPAVKSLLVRARMGLVRADTARDTACSDIREQLALAHDQGVRANSNVRRHLQDCPACRSYRGQMCLVKKRMAALIPAGPLAALARMIGLPGASATGTGGAALSATGGVSGAALGASHVAALVAAAAIATAGGAVGLEHVIATSAPAHPAVSAQRIHHGGSPGDSGASSATLSGYQAEVGAETSPAPGSGTGLAGGGGGGASSSTTTGSGTADGGTGSANSPIPTAPAVWSSTGPPPTARPTTGDTGPTPTSTGGDGSSSGSTSTTGDTGPTPATGGSSGSSASTSTGSTGTSASGSTSTDSSTTAGGTSSTSDPTATTASASDGSTSTDTSTTSSGTGSSGSGS